MVQNFFENIERIPLDAIDPEDRLFAISPPWLPLEQLIRSIKNTGLLSPLHVQRTDRSRFRLIIGFRRYQAACKLRFQEIPCIVRAEENALKLFVQALEDNLVSRPLQLVEKAHVLLKLRRHFELSTRTLLDNFAPLLDIRADRLHLERYLDLARLPKSLQRAIPKPLDPEIALNLSGWKTEEQDFFLALLSKYRLRKNKQKQLFTLLDELRALQRIAPSAPRDGERAPVEILWQKSGAGKIEQDERLPLSDRFEQVLEKLHRLRFPHLSEYEEKYAELKSALKLPPQIQFHAPRYFEGNRINVSFSFRHPQELLEVAKKLQETAKKDEVKEILELL